MTYSVTAEVRLIPGAADRLLDDLPGRAVNEGVLWYRAFGAEADPELLLFVSACPGSWRFAS